MAVGTIWIGTGVCVGVGVLLCMILPFILLRPENTRNISKKEMIGLMITLVTTAMVCLWMFWVCAYVAQMHPLIYPERPKEEGTYNLDEGTL
ncbi:conserved hypothetical protein [Neospora caninum Liverpool]|uniref:Uncharacterized protein n=1 Tax=Neospora caninum (strain Liverpool) TaxID=572307 RepID=F0VR84_NEOCL|nr:conserved hypothetical protein [Neospora caninum Liverpool]CBZ56232.1 conserved hypothetical protein [Neospora caninum Liverpool]CEL70994.1 TPA: hypothetical protein BN1204_066570 [Neospora caninum Liverpool]|eukprot:XP_003886257.1 conserved hypothetical protein [Neospora caninum Liverpool]